MKENNLSSLTDLWILSGTAVAGGGVRTGEELLRRLAICFDHSLASLPTYLITSILNVVTKVCLREFKIHESLTGYYLMHQDTNSNSCYFRLTRILNVD